MNLDKNALSPIYIIFKGIEAKDWGVFGDTIQLEDLKNPPADAQPI